jgi:hypothetical protein
MRCIRWRLLATRLQDQSSLAALLQKNGETRGQLDSIAEAETLSVGFIFEFRFSFSNWPADRAQISPCGPHAAGSARRIELQLLSGNVRLSTWPSRAFVSLRSGTTSARFSLFTARRSKMRPLVYFDLHTQ